MTIEEELVSLREENKGLREQLAQRDELIQQQQARLSEQKQCPQCQQITNAAFPAGVQAPIQYGPNVGATAVYLVEQQLLPLARACEVMRDLLFVQMSEGTVWELIKRCAGQLATVEQQFKAALIHSDVIHQDETGLDVAGKRHWMHVTCTPTLTHYHVDKSRGQAALEAIGILPQFTGISIHDGWRSYFLYDCQHAACIVHRLARVGVSGRRTGTGVGRRPQGVALGDEASHSVRSSR